LPAGQQTFVVDQDNGGWNMHYMSFASSSSTNLALGQPTSVSGYTLTYVPGLASHIAGEVVRQAADDGRDRRKVPGCQAARRSQAGH
jgi:hypothetical protein